MALILKLGLKFFAPAPDLEIRTLMYIPNPPGTYYIGY